MLGLRTFSLLLIVFVACYEFHNWIDIDYKISPCPALPKRGIKELPPLKKGDLAAWFTASAEFSC